MITSKKQVILNEIGGMKVKKKRLILSAIAFLAIALIGMALVPPPPVNQNLNLYDAGLASVTNTTCRSCHPGAPDTHHLMLSEPGRTTLGCLDCHPMMGTYPNQQVYIERNCINCHNGTAFWANPVVNIPKRPHHNTTYAINRDCRHCHGAVVANYNDGHYVPAYATSLVTPYADNKVYNATSGRYWGGCIACHQNRSDVTPAILNNHDTHHGAILGSTGTSGNACNWCHVINVTSGGVARVIAGSGQGGPLNNPSLTYPYGRILELRNSSVDALNGTGCEKCHSVMSIHNIQWDYANTNGLAGYGHIGTNWDCNGCHAFWDAGAAIPLAGPINPDMFSITPNKLTPGVETQVTITGINLVQEPFTTAVSVDGVALIPTSITDTQITLTIPALGTGVHEIQLVKGDAASKLSTLVVVSPVEVGSAKLSQGKILVAGTGFGPQPDPVFNDLGVFIADSGKKGQTNTFRANIISWSNTEIVISGSGASGGNLLTVKSLNGEDSTRIRGGGKK